jgi:hypothetical protein
MALSEWHLDPDRFFDAEPTQRRVARELYAQVADLRSSVRMGTWTRASLSMSRLLLAPPRRC